MTGGADGPSSDGRGRCATRRHSPRRQRLDARPGVYCEEEPGPASSSHGVHCHLTVMRGQLRFELARSVAAARYAGPNAPPLFRCPSCKALYQVVKAEAGPETVDLEVACSICRGPLGAREGQFVLKYFLLRKAIPVKRPTARRARPR